MASSTTPHGLPIIEGADYIRSASSGNLHTDINSLATKTNAALSTVKGQAIEEASDRAESVAQQIVGWGVDQTAIPTRGAPEGSVYAWADVTGRVSMTIDEDAALHLHRDPFSPSMRPLTVSQGWRWGVSDEEGHLTAAVDDRGSFQVFRGAGAKTAILGQVACIGDSLTNGYSGGSTWPAAQSWPMQMAANRPDLTVTKLGFNGNTTDEVRLRVGALPLMISGATGNTIPSTGTVNVTTRQQVGWGTANVAVAGTIAGIGGTLTHDGSTLTFTRNGQGDPYTITAPVRFVPNVDDYSSHNVVLWVGRNDINSGVTGAEASTAEHVVAGVLETVEWLAPRTKSIVVVSAINQNKEPRGHERYQVVQDINAGLKAALPHKFLDIRSYLVNQAIYDAGLTPTATDLQNIADDCPPAQIWDDGSHYLPIVAPHVAAFIQTRLEAKGLI